MKRKGALALTVFTRIMLIFLVIAIVAMIWMFIGKVQEVKMIAEHNEKKLIIWDSLLAYKPLRAYSEYGDMEILYDYNRLNDMIKYDSLDCDMGLIHPDQKRCIKIYPNNYFFRIELEDIPAELSDEELLDYYQGVGDKCETFFDEMANYYSIKGDVKLTAVFDQCSIGISDILLLAPPYSLTKLKSAINSYKLCAISVNSNLDDKQKAQIGDMLDFCSRTSGGESLEWRWGDSNIPVKFKEIVGIKIGDKYYIGKAEAGVELLE